MGWPREGKGVLALGVGSGPGVGGEGGSRGSRVAETPAGRFARGKDCCSANGWLWGVRESFTGALFHSAEVSVMVSGAIVKSSKQNS